jgi:hypothetical protein
VLFPLTNNFRPLQKTKNQLSFLQHASITAQNFKMPPKRKALKELDRNQTSIANFLANTSQAAPEEQPTSGTPNSNSSKVKLTSYLVKDSAPSSKAARVNVGGASKLTWFNVLASDQRLRDAKANSVQKIASTSNDNGCVVVRGFNEETRPVMDKSHLEGFRKICPDAPARYAPYHIALLQANKLVPDNEPCSYPEELRLVKHKRVKTEASGNEKGATWVTSHLCHNKCINVNHLTWEPSWFNRLRDNCPGGQACVHRPHACLQPHRPADSQLIDWTEYM